MKSRRILSFVLAVTLSAFSLSRAAVNEELAKKLFSAPGTREEFTKVAEDAKKSGAKPQLLAEAKLVWGLRHKDTEFLAQILPELEEAAKDFKKEDSAGLGSAEDFKALIIYIKALEAVGRGDEAALKENITEAFWLSPEQAPLFAQTITYFRIQAKMAHVTVDMQMPVTNSGGKSTTLTEVLGKQKAVLLDFWASWCAPCMELMPDVRRKAAYLSKHGIAVAGMNIESDEVIADKVRTEKEMKEVTWLVEPGTRPLSGLLDIPPIPRMILLSPDGKVLYNGHPEDAALWTALKKSMLQSRRR